jgi:hypothetical protein
MSYKKDNGFIDILFYVDFIRGKLFSRRFLID